MILRKQNRVGSFVYKFNSKSNFWQISQLVRGRSVVCNLFSTVHWCARRTSKVRRKIFENGKKENFDQKFLMYNVPTTKLI